MQKTILAIGLLALIGAFLTFQTGENTVTQQFENFKAKYNKKYGSQEETYRMAVYAANKQFVEEFNAKKGKAVFGETIFFDLTDEEFAATYLTLQVEEENVQKVSFKNVSETPIDWRSRGAVTDVKDQGQCGSCWTFGTTGTLEGFYAVKTGELPNLSEQQLVDCSTWTDLNFGCNGGMPARALNYVKRNGITTQDAYPYTAVQGNCAIKGGAFKINGHTAVEATEASLVGALASLPVSIAVDATNWKYYDPATELVFSDCEEALNHAVLAVGFNANAFIVKNSWSTKWGEKGYIHLKRGQNTCGIFNSMVIPN